jgi:hypothetical protein
MQGCYLFKIPNLLNANSSFLNGLLITQKCTKRHQPQKLYSQIKDLLAQFQMAIFGSLPEKSVQIERWEMYNLQKDTTCLSCLQETLFCQKSKDPFTGTFFLPYYNKKHKEWTFTKKYTGWRKSSENRNSYSIIFSAYGLPDKLYTKWKPWKF